jgi:hypothetical protein
MGLVRNDGGGSRGRRRTAILDQDFFPGTALVTTNERPHDNAAELLGSLGHDVAHLQLAANPSAGTEFARGVQDSRRRRGDVRS